MGIDLENENYSDNFVKENDGVASDDTPPQEQEAAQSDDVENDSDEMTFEDLGLDEKILAAVARKGFKVPSPIQVLAIPRLLNGDANVIARARTGTGKTAAFGLPIVQRIRAKPGKGVRALVLEPTRELAVQAAKEMQSFGENDYPRARVVYGGASMSTQIKEMRQGAEIVVGTPGRVQDLMERGVLDISNIDYFILDEGDEMLDMGFIDDIEAIFESANPDCRVLLFSATMPKPILRIAEQFMGDYEIVEEEGVVEEPLKIDQKYWVVRENEKIEALVRLIDMSPDFYGLVFTMTKVDADNVTRALDERGYEAAALHGDIMQSQREKVLARFRKRKTRILVATDVAARGIDINGLSHVVNFSLPFDGVTYVHRIGRTGRAGATGTAITFVRPEEMRRKLQHFQTAARKASKGELVEGDIPTIEDVISVKRERLFEQLKKQIIVTEKKYDMKNDGADFSDSENNENIIVEGEVTFADGASSIDMSAETETSAVASVIKPEKIFSKMAGELCENQNPEEVLAAVLSVMYGTSLDRSHYGTVSSENNASKKERGAKSGGFSSDSEQMRLYVQMGRRDGYSPRAIAEYFADLLHIPQSMVDRIDMSSSFTLLSLPIDSAKHALEMSQHGGNNLPHMHIDDKPSKGGRGGRERGRGRDRGERGGRDRDRRERGFGGRDRDRDRDRFSSGFGGSRADRFGRGFSDGDFGGGRERDRKRSFRERDRARDSHSDGFYRSNSRPNVHTPTERSGSSSFFRSRERGAERF